MVNHLFALCGAGHKRRPVRLAALLAAFLVSPLAGAVTFAPAVSYELSETSPVDIVLGDFTNDGHADMAVSMSGEAGGVGSVSILAGDGLGAFPSHYQINAANNDGLGYAPTGLASGYFDADANLDLAVTAGGAGSSAVHIYLGNGAGGFLHTSSLTSGGQSPWTAVSGDFDGDGQTDLAVGNNLGTGAGVSIFLGQGDGSFSAAQNVATTSSVKVADLVTGDFDQDGDTDLATPSLVLLNDGAGGFSRGSTIGLSNAVGMVAADFDLDGWLDLAVAAPGSIDIWTNNGDGSFAFANNYPQNASQITGITTVDVDKDAKPDLIVSDESSDEVKVFLGDGLGGLGSAQAFATGIQPKAVAAADWNGDQLPDIAAPYRNNGNTPYASVLLQSAGPVPSAGSVQFSATNYQGLESGAGVLVTLTRSGGSFGAISIDYASSDGTATAGSDYTAVAGTLGFADGELSASFTLPLLDDALYEGDESLNLSLSNPGGGASLGTPTSASVTVLDDEPPPSAGSVQFSMATYQVDENGGSALITLTRSGGSFGAISVDYASSDGTATAGSDYSAVAGTLILADGVISAVFSVPVLDDALYEGDESLTLTLSNPGGGAVLGSPALASLSVTDNDPVPPAGSLQFAATDFQLAENGGSALITVSRSGGSFGAVSIDYASSDGSATAGLDYTAVAGTLQLADGELSATFSVPVLDDALYEGDENLTLSLSNPGGGASLGALADATLTVLENDPLPLAGSVQFSGAAYQVAEDGGSVLITVTRSGGSHGAISIDYASSDGTATAGSDYSAVAGTLNFADGVLSASFSVPVLDDAVYEGEENLSLTLSNPVGGATLGSPALAVLTLTDNEAPPPAGSLQFSGAAYQVAENGGSALITVTRSGGSFGAVSVDYASSDGTATAGNDYSAVVGTLNFADGVVSASFSVPILDDALYEGKESLSLSLSNPGGGAVLGSPALAVLSLMDNDPVPPAGSLQFSGTNYHVAENGGSALITVTRSGGSYGAISVDYASSDGSATAGSDYSAVAGTLNFADGVISASFSVTILDDSLYEGNESLSLTLSNPAGGAALGTPAGATLTLLENDPLPPAGSVQFASGAYQVAENSGSALITVTRSGGSFGAITVDYASSDGTASAGSDYSAVSGTLSMADGGVSASFSVPILDDSLYEGNESLSLILSNPAGGAALGTPAGATLTLLENDPQPPAGSVQFASGAYQVAEDGGSVLITVVRSGGSFGAITVDYTSSDGTASAGSDYSAVSGTLSMADGVVSASFSLPILDDSVYEGDESLSLTLSQATGGAGIGTPATVGVTIQDNESAPLDSNGDGLMDEDALRLGLDPYGMDGDSDDDGLSDVQELGGDLAHPLDSDADGLIDALEPGESANDGALVSGLPLSGGGSVSISTEAGEQLSGVQIQAVTGGPAGVDFPYGALSYTTSSAPGASVRILIQFSEALPNNAQLYKVDEAGGFTLLPAQLWERLDDWTLALTLTDGDPLTDEDGLVNGSITDPMALGVSTSGGSSSDSSVASGGGGGCSLNASAGKDPTFPTIIMLSMLYLWRRRQRGAPVNGDSGLLA